MTQEKKQTGKGFTQEDIPSVPSNNVSSDSPRKWVTRKELIELSRINPFRVFGGVLLTWLNVFFLLQLVIWTQSVWVGVGSFFFIGCLQNALVLLTHEASHFNFSRNRVLNDMMADLFVSGPTGITVGQYRWQHMRHHRYLGNPMDEIDLSAWICLRGTHLFSEILQALLGIYGLQIIGRYRKKKIDPRYIGMPNRSMVSLTGFVLGNGLIFILCAWQGYWYFYFFLWALPLFTLALLINNFRTIVEHQPSSDVCEKGLVAIPPITRVIRSRFIERLLIAPIGFYYHFEHHLFPNIPYHRLSDVRKILAKRGYFDNNHIVWTEGYLRTIWNLAINPAYGLRF